MKKHMKSTILVALCGLIIGNSALAVDGQPRRSTNHYTSNLAEMMQDRISSQSGRRPEMEYGIRSTLKESLQLGAAMVAFGAAGVMGLLYASRLVKEHGSNDQTASTIGLFSAASLFAAMEVGFEFVPSVQKLLLLNKCMNLSF